MPMGRCSGEFGKSCGQQVDVVVVCEMSAIGRDGGSRRILRIRWLATVTGILRLEENRCEKNDSVVAEGVQTPVIETFRSLRGDLPDKPQEERRDSKFRREQFGNLSLANLNQRERWKRIRN